MVVYRDTTAGNASQVVVDDIAGQCSVGTVVEIQASTLAGCVAENIVVRQNHILTAANKDSTAIRVGGVGGDGVVLQRDTVAVDQVDAATAPPRSIVVDPIAHQLGVVTLSEVDPTTVVSVGSIAIDSITYESGIGAVIEEDATARVLGRVVKDSAVANDGLGSGSVDAAAISTGGAVGQVKSI